VAATTSTCQRLTVGIGGALLIATLFLPWAGTCAHHGDRKFSLNSLMYRSDHRFQLFTTKKLNLVEQ
jgi:hypothetical protein